MHVKWLYVCCCVQACTELVCQVLASCLHALLCATVCTYTNYSVHKHMYICTYIIYVNTYTYVHCICTCIIILMYNTYVHLIHMYNTDVQHDSVCTHVQYQSIHTVRVHMSMYLCVWILLAMKWLAHCSSSIIVAIDHSTHFPFTKPLTLTSMADARLQGTWSIWPLKQRWLLLQPLKMALCITVVFCSDPAMTIIVSL